MKKYRCSLTGFFSKVNNNMVYDKNKTVILNINVPDTEIGADLGIYLMGNLFSPVEPMEDFPLNTYCVGDYSSYETDSGRPRVYTFYKEDDPLMERYLNWGTATRIETNGPMTFKINKLSDSQKLPDKFSKEPYLDVFDVLKASTNIASDNFESLGYELAKVSATGKQIVFRSLGAVNMSRVYNSTSMPDDDDASIACVGAAEYFHFEPMEQYDSSSDSGGILKIIDTVTKESRTYYFDDFYKFFNSQMARNTIAFNHQSLIVEETSASGVYGMKLYGQNTPTGETVHDVKVIIWINNPEFKLKGMYNQSITGDGTNVLNACLKNPVYQE